MSNIFQRIKKYFTRKHGLHYPPEHKVLVEEAMAQAVHRSGGHEFHYKLYEWDFKPGIMQGGKWGGFMPGTGVFAGGYTTGTKGSGKWKSVIFLHPASGESNMRRATWEAMNVLSGIVTGRVTDGNGPEGWRWP